MTPVAVSTPTHAFASLTIALQHDHICGLDASQEVDYLTMLYTECRAVFSRGRQFVLHDVVLDSIRTVNCSASGMSSAKLDTNRFSPSIHCIMIGMIGATLCIAFLMMSGQHARASDFCGMLDRIVASANENPPFQTSRYLDVPNAKCQVGTAESHKRIGMKLAADNQYRSHLNSLACIWKDVSLLESGRQYWKIRRKRNNAKNKLDDISASDPRHNEVEAEYEHLRRETRAAGKEWGRKSDQLHSRVRKFVYSIQQCLTKGKIRGAWHSFNDRVEGGGRFLQGQWWVNSKHADVEIYVMAESEYGYLGMEVWKRKAR